MGFGNLKKTLLGEEDNENTDSFEPIETTTMTPVTKKETKKDVSGNKMILFEPRAYSESQQIADYLKNENAVIINLKRIEPNNGKRVIDFLSGCLYAIGGGMEKLGNGIFLCTPNNVSIEGKMTDDAKPTSKVKPKEEKNSDEQEIDW